jgi:non-specific serine/threonine protein kinase
LPPPPPWGWPPLPGDPGAPSRSGRSANASGGSSCRGRLSLRADLGEAEGFNDPVRAARARAEVDALTGELARAVGLGGRDHRAASHAERARLNVTRAIRAAMANLARADPPSARTERPPSAPTGTAATPPDPAPRSPGNCDPCSPARR